MTVKEQRKQLIDWVKTVDPVAFDSLEALMKQYPKASAPKSKPKASPATTEEDEDEFPAHILPGPPMSIEKYRQMILDSKAEVEKGNLYTQEEIEKEWKEW